MGELDVRLRKKTRTWKISLSGIQEVFTEDMEIYMYVKELNSSELFMIAG